jgi:HK97 family phage major capsid protein
MASPYLERQFEQYRAAHKVANDLMDLAAGENRDLSAEEQEQVERARKDAEARSAEIKRIQDFESVAVAADAFRSAAAPTIEAARAERRLPTDMEMFRSMFRESGGYDSMPTGISQRTEDPVLTLRALQSAGGSAVETSFADFVTVYERTFSPMLRPDVVTLLNRSDGSPLVLPRVTADPAAGGTITAEAGGITELDATISQVTLNPYKYAITNLWSSELAQDNTIGLEDLIARTTGRELGIDIGAALTVGDGTDDPNGFVTAATVGGTGVGTGTTYGTYFGPTDLVSLFYTIAAPYRQVGSWQANSVTLAQIRNARSTAGEHIWQPSLQVGQPETLLGRPLYENPAMANGSAAKSVAFGDFSRYVVARVVPIRVETSIHYKFNTDQIAMRTIERVDGDLVDVAGIRVLLNAAV